MVARHRRCYCSLHLYSPPFFCVKTTKESYLIMSRAKVSFNPEPFECDRRLSRAARELVKQNIIPLLPHDLNEQNVSEILRQSILDSSACIFHPDRDLLLNDELHSQRIPAGPRQTSPRKQVSHWQQCLYCKKTFLTKYYLDLHLETAHARVSSQENVCPAVSYCQVLGGCDHLALELEPFYARGSGGVGPDAFQVRQMWSHQLQSCNEAILKDQVQPSCRQVMKDCFAPEVADNLIAGVCDTLTCHNRLHQLAGHMIQHVHSWKSLWDQHHNHSVGWLGIVVIMVLMIYYMVLYMNRQPAKSTNRLLSKKSTDSKWKRFGRTPTKKKLH